MRVLRGATIVEAEGLPALEGRRLVIDVGAGDGRFVYECARADAGGFYIALEPDADALGEYAYRASRKRARGGVGNVMFVVASIEAQPPELLGTADGLYVNFPWAGLLRGLLLPEACAISAIGCLLKSGGRFEIVLTFDPEHDAGVFGDVAGPALDTEYLEHVLKPAYATGGLEIERARELSREEALAIPSTWGRRLLHGRPRRVFSIAGKRL
jgi:SAM-dependent methyltransferase